MGDEAKPDIDSSLNGAPTTDHDKVNGVERQGRTNVSEALRDRYYSGIEVGALAMAALAIASSLLFRDKVPPTHLALWLAATLVASALLPILKYTRLDFRTWRPLVLALELTHGVLWGSLPVFLMPAEPLLQGIVSAVTVGVLLGGSVSSSQFLWAFFAYTIPLAGLSTYGFLASPIEGSETAAVLVLIAWAYGLSVALDQRKLYLDLVTTALTNGDLVEELTEERRLIALANENLAVAVGRAEEMARTDPLTGLANRLRMQEYLADVLTHLSLGSASRVTFAYLDLDGFKGVNDTFGHRAGDQLLVVVGQRLSSAVDDCELVVRLGGDELVVISPIRSATTLGALIHSVFEQPIQLRSQNLVVTASIGVASTSAVVGEEKLMKRADAAQYEAKRAGGDRVVVANAAASGDETIEDFTSSRNY